MSGFDPIGGLIGAVLGSLLAALLVYALGGLIFGVWNPTAHEPDWFVAVAVAIGMPLGFGGYVAGSRS